MAHLEIDTHGSPAGKVSVDAKGDPRPNMSDNWFGKIEDYLYGSISRFVGFLFFLITAGAVLGYIVAQRGEGEIIILVPAAAGLLAYYSRDFALAVLGIVVILVIL